MKILVASITLIILCFFCGFSQTKKQIKAEQFYKDGLMASASMDSEGAIALYKKALKINPSYNSAWLQLAVTLSKMGVEPSTQKQALINILKTDSVSKTGLLAYNKLIKLYQDEGAFDSVAWAFDKTLAHNLLSESQRQKLEEKGPSIRFAAKNYKSPLKFEPFLLNAAINDPNALQYFPIITGAGDQIIFTRRYKGSQNEDIYIAKKTHDWNRVEKLSNLINSSEGEGTATISANGKTLICSYCGNRREGFGNCDLFISNYSTAGWSQLKNLGAVINTKHYEAQPSLSADGRILFFVSDRPNGEGGLDIYYSLKNSKGQWTAPKNLGSTINTKDNEVSPFIHTNGQTLFFASKGHVGFGGYDLFATHIERKQWQQPYNLGYPINDQLNQLSMCVAPDGKTGYFSKEEFSDAQLKSNMSRIWSFVVPPEFKLGHRSNIISGKVYNNLTKNPIKATLKLINLETTEVTSLVTSNPSNGEYFVMLAEGADYAFYTENPGFLFKSIAFEYNEQNNTEPIKLDIYLDPIIKGVTVSLNNIYFQTGKSTLLGKSKVELKKLYQLMKTNPLLKIEIGGHTDNVGSDEVNYKLSNDRVNSVIAYLKKGGINSSRMIGKGYGPSKPIVENNTKAGQKKNRRVEFTVVAVD